MGERIDLGALPFPAPNSWRFKRRITERDIREANPYWRSPEGVCRWCGQPIDRSVEEDRRRRNWHARCNRQFARLFFSPRWVVEERDHGVCAECGLDCAAIDRRLSDLRWKYRRRAQQERIGNWLMRVFGWPYGIAHGQRSTWDADHIVAVADGGGLLGEDNIQTLCWRCHWKKTNGSGVVTPT